MQGDSVKRNIYFQFLYQVLVLIIPLVLAPYLTRTLGDTALGIYSFTYSVGQIFVVVANLGIAKYGQRLIAEKKNNSEQLRKTFWSLFVVHAIVSLTVFAGFMLFSFLWGGQRRDNFLIQGFYVLSAFFDITWLYYGIEKFKGVVIRNTVVKLLELVLIFSFVHSPSDLNKYTLIMSSSVMMGMAMLLPPSIRMIPPIRFSIQDCKAHIRPLCILFIASVATLLFTFFDKTLLGMFSTVENVAYYEYSNRIVMVPRTIATVISTVMYSRACVFIREAEFDKAKKYRDYSLTFAYIISFASIFGLLAVGDVFVNLYYGKDFAECVGIINALSPTVLIVSVADIIRTQLLIPLHKDREYTVVTIISAILNIAASLLLLKPLGVYGVVVGSIAAEGFSLAATTYLCKKYINLGKGILEAIPYCMIGVVMFLVVQPLRALSTNTVIALLAQVAIGAVIYGALSILYMLFLSPSRENYRQFVDSVLLKLRRGKRKT